MLVVHKQVEPEVHVRVPQLVLLGTVDGVGKLAPPCVGDEAGGGSRQGLAVGCSLAIEQLVVREAVVGVLLENESLTEILGGDVAGELAQQVVEDGDLHANLMRSRRGR